MHFGLTLSTSFTTTNTNARHRRHLSCTIHGVVWRRPSVLVNSLLLYHPDPAAYNRRRCFGLRRYRSHSTGKHHFRNIKREEFDDDQPQRKQEPVVTIPVADDDDQSSQLLQFGNSAILSACFVGLFTGFAVVLFNYTVITSASSVSRQWRDYGIWINWSDITCRNFICGAYSLDSAHNKNIIW